MSNSPARQAASSYSNFADFHVEIAADSCVKENGLRVLHVDDDAGFLEVTKTILSIENNFEIDGATSVDEAFRKMENTSYDVIVSDLEMPFKNGLAFLKELKSQNNEIPFILLTGKGREEIAIKALNLGADGYVNKQGDPETVYGVLAHCIRQNVEKNRAETRLRLSEERLKTIVMNAPIGIATSDVNKRFINANEAFCKILGYTEEELRKLTFREITHPLDLTDSIEKVEELKTGKSPQITLEKRYIRKDGKTIHGKINVAAIRDKDAKATFFIAELEDITEHKLAEETLKETEEKYRILFEQTGDYILVLEVHPDRLPTIFDANDSALQFHGYSRNEVLGKPITFLDEESTRQIMQERIKRLLNNEKLTFEARHRRKDGALLTAEVSIKMAKVGSKIFLVSVERDITNRKKIEEEIKKERDMIEAVTKSIGAGFVIIGKDYHIKWANNFIREYKGEVDGKLCYSVLNNLDAPCPDCGVTKVFNQEKTQDAHDYFSTTVDGKPYWVNIIATPIKDKSGNIIAASELAVDITEEKQREKDLEGSQQEFKALFNSNPEAVAYADGNNKIVNVNPKFTEVFGFLPQEVKGKDLAGFMVPDELKEERQMQTGRSPSQTVSFESIRKCKNGSLLNVYLSIAPISVSGNVIGSVAVYKDMSAIVSAERKIEEALKQSQILNEKLNVIGSFTRHDVANKLAVINGNVYLAKKNANENPLIQNNLDQIKLASNNIVRILEFAKNYEGLGKEQRTYVNVGKAIDEAASLFADLKGVKIINSCKDFNILADSMLTTVFHNLIDNSLKYGEKLNQIEVYARQEPDGSNEIIYEDNGIGIDAETKKQLFNKGFGKGTGYGLYLIRRTCDIYGWTVKETGAPGKGVRFEFTIPANQQQKVDLTKIKMQ